MKIKLILKFSIVLITFSCNNSIKNKSKPISINARSSNKVSNFEIEFLDKKPALKPTKYEEVGDKIRLKITNVSKTDTLYFYSLRDSIIPSFGYESTINYNGKNIWGHNSNTSGVYTAEKPFRNYILPQNYKIVIYHLFAENKSSDSVGLGFDCIIRGKTIGKTIRFKNKNK